MQHFSTIVSSHITDNTASSYGGGIYTHHTASKGVIINCRITGNVGQNGGGGVTLSGSNDVMESCTIASNRTTLNSGGGIYIRYAGTNIVRNNVIYGNTASGANTNWMHDTGAGVEYINSCTMPTNNLPGANNIQADPKFIGDWRLGRIASDSPCINTGLNQPWMVGAVDFDGRARIDRFSRQVDMGCYEYLPNGAMFLGR